MPEPVKVRIGHGRRIQQGDVFRDIEFVESAVENKGIVQVSKIIFPLVVVLTQDCDLEQDYKARYGRKDKPKNQDKRLFSVLVAPLYNIEHVYNGEHLSVLEIDMAEVPRKGNTGNFLRQNTRPRYHVLKFPKGIPLPESIVDFKHYFSVNVEYLKQMMGEKHVCNIAPLYRENLVQRFASFLSRIGLPQQKKAG